MAVEFTNEKRFIGFWFVWPPKEPFRHRRADWFAASWLNPDGTLEFNYRFHYYDEPKDPSEGERSWYAMKSKHPVDDAEIEKHKTFMTEMGKLNVTRNRSRMEFIDCGLCNGDEALAALEDQVWWHKKEGRCFQEE